MQSSRFRAKREALFMMIMSIFQAIAPFIDREKTSVDVHQILPHLFLQHLFSIERPLGEDDFQGAQPGHPDFLHGHPLLFKSNGRTEAERP